MKRHRAQLPTREQVQRAQWSGMASDILTLNAGSSTLKFSLWQLDNGTDLRELFRGEVEKIGIDPHLSAWGPGGEAVIDRGFGEGGANLTHEDLLRELFTWLWQQRQDGLEAIGHRIVHGGATFTAPVCINDEVLDKLSRAASRMLRYRVSPNNGSSRPPPRAAARL